MNEKTADSINTYFFVKSRIFFILKLLFTLIMFIYLITFIQFENILRVFLNSNIYLITLSIFLLIPNIYLQYYKWRITCNQLLEEKNKRKIFLSLLYGFPPAVFTPGRLGEYFGRGLALKKINISEVMLAAFIDKLFNILVTYLFGSIAMLIFIDSFYELSKFISFPLIGVFLLFSFLITLSIFINKNFTEKLLNLIQKKNIFRSISSRLLILKKLSKTYSIKMFLLSALFLACYVLQFLILMTAYSHHFSFLNYLWAAILIMFSKSFFSPLTISDLGVREGISVFFLTRFGEPESVALNASLSLFVINVILPAVMGLVFYFMKDYD